MASFAQPAKAASRSSTSHRYSEQPSQLSSSRRSLPEGSCNYKNLSAGGDQPTCGCRRFWDIGSPNICVCGHHACFHDDVELLKSSGNLQPAVETSTSRHSLIPATFSSQINYPRPASASSSQVRDFTSSDQGTSGLPPIPDICLLSPDKNKGRKSRRDENIQVAGLGLTVHSSLDRLKQQPSPGSTIGDQIDFNVLRYLDPEIPSTRQSSTTDDDRQNLSPDPAFVESVMQNRAIIGPPLDVPVAEAASVAYEDFIQSPTEVATPSIAATPDFKALDQLVQDTKGLADILNRTKQAIDNATGQSRDISALAMTRQGTSRPKKSASPANRTSPYRDSVKKQPSTLQQLLPHLNNLNSQLASISNLSATINALTGRLGVLERASFDHISPSEINQRLEPIDTRLVEVEERLDDHGRRLGAIEVEVNGSTHGLYTSNAGSFVSNRLNDAESRLKEIEGLLDQLKTTVPPSLATPWQIEVVLLPWGRDLRGVWAPAEELDKPRSKTTTQRSEEWSDTRALRATSSSFHSIGESAWSSDAIHQWMDEADEWLFPKACGPNNLVYQRLKSRGFVHQVSLTGPEYNDVRAAIRRTFTVVLNTISRNRVESSERRSDADEIDTKRFLGLSAPFIPLRKIHKSSKLRFLLSTEMLSSAIWTASFLASNVFMKAAGGQRRLYLTTRDGYLQLSENLSPSWNWAKIQDLPLMAEHVEGPKMLNELDPETDGSCWEYHPELDAASSVYSSFDSQVSVDAARAQPAVSILRPAYWPSDSHELHALRSDSGTHPAQPITPTSELPYSRIRAQHHRRQRTVSVPLSDVPSGLTAEASHPKRRVRSFEQTHNPLIDKIPSFVSAKPRGTLIGRREKRRRITRSRSASSSSHSGASAPGGTGTHARALDTHDAIIERHIAYLETGDDRALQRGSSGGGGSSASVAAMAFALATPRRSREPASLSGAAAEASALLWRPAFDPSAEPDLETVPKGAQGALAGFAAPAAAPARDAKRASTPAVYMTPFSGTFAPAGSVGMAGEGRAEDDEDGDGEGEVWSGLDGEELAAADEEMDDDEVEYGSMLEDDADDEDLEGDTGYQD